MIQCPAIDLLDKLFKENGHTSPGSICIGRYLDDSNPTSGSSNSPPLDVFATKLGFTFKNGDDDQTATSTITKEARIIQMVEGQVPASFYFDVGTAAAKASDFRTALSYMKVGLHLLGDRPWRNEYDLCLSLHNASAEMELCIGNVQAMDELIDTILKQAIREEDKTQAYATRIYALGISGQPAESVELGILVLRGLGEKFPRFFCRKSLSTETQNINRLLRGKTDDRILGLPEITDERKLASMNILQLMFMRARLSKPKLAPIIASRLVLLTLKYGLSVYASVAFSFYGMILVEDNHDIQQAFRFGALGLKLLIKYNVTEYLPRVYAVFYGCIYSWKKPFHDTLAPLLKAHQIGMQTGDIEFAALCSCYFCISTIHSGKSADRTFQQWECRQSFLSSSKIDQGKSKSTSISYQKHLGFNTTLKFFDNCSFDELGQMETCELLRLENDYCTNLRCMILLYVFGNYKSAEEAAQRIQKSGRVLVPSVSKVTSAFFTGMISLQMIAVRTGCRKNKRTAKRCIKLLRRFSQICHINCSAKFHLLEAEFANVSGQISDAIVEYNHAITTAQDSGLVLIYALACERFARFNIRIGRLLQAESYYHTACAAYEEWGSKMKVTYLRREMRPFFQ
jgi:hypothetical protein